MRGRGTTNKTSVRLASLGDRLTHDSPTRAPGFRSQHTHVHTHATHRLHSQLLCTDNPLHSTTFAVGHDHRSPSTARSPTVSALTVSPSLLQFICDPILPCPEALLGPSWAQSPRIGMLRCFCLLGLSRLSLPSLRSSWPLSKNLVQTALWGLPQTNELLDDSVMPLRLLSICPDG